MARIQDNALIKNPRLRILDIRIANSQPKILNQKMSPSYRTPSIQVAIFGQERLPPFLSTHYAASASTTTAVSQNIHIHKLISVLILFSYVYGKKIRIK